MPGEGPPSEYGGKIGDNTVYPKLSDALSSGDKLRLVYQTGQEDDALAPVDKDAFIGGRVPPPEGAG